MLIHYCEACERNLLFLPHQCQTEMEKVAMVCQLVQKIWNVRLRIFKSQISQLELAFLCIPVFSLFRKSSQ